MSEFDKVSFRVKINQISETSPAQILDCANIFL